MLTLLMALTVSTHVAVEATGMEPQLRIVRMAAAGRNWPITCKGHAGEEGVVRVGIPPGTSREAVNDFIDAMTPIASSVGNLGVDATKRTCSHKTFRTESSGDVHALMFTNGLGDASLLATARACGFTRAYWRPSRPEDFVRFGGRIDPRKYSTTLDAEEDADRRSGPMICFLNLGVRPLKERAK